MNKITISTETEVRYIYYNVIPTWVDYPYLTTFITY